MDLSNNGESPTKAATVAHGIGPPSDWVLRWSRLIREGGSVLDVACGHGRHMGWLASRGFQVTGIDRSPEAILAVSALGEAICSDIEKQPWPLLANGEVRRFDAVVVTNYLWRANFPVIYQSLLPGGVLIYETFTKGQESVGKPSRPDFLLDHRELLNAFSQLRVVAFEDGFLSTPDRFVQRITAIKETNPQNPEASASRYPL